jgi:hypothetical protein
VIDSKVSGRFGWPLDDDVWADESWPARVAALQDIERPSGEMVTGDVVVVAGLGQMTG